MIMNIDTNQMINELYAMDVPLQINSDWSDEEYHNYIIHMYDVFLIPNDWANVQDIANKVYAVRKFRNQIWVDSNAWRYK